MRNLTPQKGTDAPEAGQLFLGDFAPKGRDKGSHMLQIRRGTHLGHRDMQALQGGVAKFLTRKDGGKRMAHFFRHAQLALGRAFRPAVMLMLAHEYFPAWAA
jgi:hypothetical protein